MSRKGKFASKDFAGRCEGFASLLFTQASNGNGPASALLSISALLRLAAERFFRVGLRPRIAFLLTNTWRSIASGQTPPA